MKENLTFSLQMNFHFQCTIRLSILAYSRQGDKKCAPIKRKETKKVLHKKRKC